MKKSTLAITLLLAIVAGTSLSSCKKAETEKIYTTEEQKSKLDETGEAFVKEADLENWKATADVVVPGIDYLGGVDLSAALDKEYGTVSGNDVYVDYSLIKGHYVVNSNTHAAEAETGTFDDLQISYEYEGHKYVVVIAVTPGEQTFLVDKGEDGNTYLVVPTKIVANFTVDGTVQFALEFALSFSGIDNLNDEPDFSKVNISTNCKLSSAGYVINLSKLSYATGSFAEAFNFNYNKKLLLSVKSNATELAVKEGDVVCTKADLAVDVLGEVQLKGDLKYDDLMKIEPEESPKTIEEGNALADEINKCFNLNLYYDGGNTAQASFKITAFEDEEGNIDAMPALYFNDGTSYAFEEFFSEENFSKTFAAVDNLVSAIEEYFRNLELE